MFTQRAPNWLEFMIQCYNLVKVQPNLKHRFVDLALCQTL